MNKIFFITISIMLASSVAFAQDTIVKNNGEQIECSILEVTPMFVKCGKYDSQEETIYRFVIEDIWIIKYESGEITYFIDNDDHVPLSTKKGSFGYDIYFGEVKLNSRKVKQLFTVHEEALSKYKSGKAFVTIGNIIALPSAFAMGWQLGSIVARGEVNREALMISGIGTAVGLILVIIGDNSIKKSVKIYNSEIDGNTSLSLEVGFLPNGFGLYLSF